MMSQSFKMTILSCAILLIGFAGISLYDKTHANRGGADPSHVDTSALHQKSEVIIYSTTTCPYCYKAKDLLRDYNITYIERDLADQKNLQEFMDKLPGVRGVPQIFIGGEHIGGYSELKDLADSEQLMKRVAQ